MLPPTAARVDMENRNARTDLIVNVNYRPVNPPFTTLHGLSGMRCIDVVTTGVTAVEDLLSLM